MTFTTHVDVQYLLTCTIHLKSTRFNLSTNWGSSRDKKKIVNNETSKQYKQLIYIYMYIFLEEGNDITGNT